MSRIVSRFLLLVAVVAVEASASAAPPRALLELEVGKDKLIGTIAAHDAKSAWLLGRDGRLTHVAMKSVGKFREIESHYRPYSQADLRDMLEREFGPSNEVVGTGRYLVAGRRGEARKFAPFFEELYRQFVVYFGARGFSMKEPEYPLIAVVFPDHAQFRAYCKKEGFEPPPGMVGFYVATSNRIAMYDTRPSDEGVAASVHETLVHEATHQLAFNMGIHTRIGDDPQWVVEGLATAFEPEGIRVRRPESTAFDRLNRERFRWYMAAQKKSPSVGTLKRLVETDDLFQSSTLDAYAHSWAMTFYLQETRAEQYVRYLKQIARRDVIKFYPPKQRLDDFKAAFGNDVDQLDRDMARFITRLGE